MRKSLFVLILSISVSICSGQVKYGAVLFSTNPAEIMPLKPTMFTTIGSSVNVYRVPVKDSNEVSSPKRAAIMSAIIPGLGQVYNDKYWKIGIIYAGAFGLGYGLKYNLDSMRRYQRSLSARIDTSAVSQDIWYPSFSDAKVQNERDYYRKNRDLIIIGMVALYALQIIDANVDAHLREFDVNKDLALKVKPSIQYHSSFGVQPMCSFSFRIK
jgi:hypothetical protein